MKILIIGRADTIFLVNYVRALKEEMNGTQVHVYSPFADSGDYPAMPYDKVSFDDYTTTKWNQIPKVSFLFQPFVLYRHLVSYLEANKQEQYDVIHFHRILPAWTLGNYIYKKYCKKLFITFWGGELDNSKILYSSKLYSVQLEKLLKSCDRIIGAMSDKRYSERYPFIKSKSSYGILGSSIIDYLNENNALNEGKAKQQYHIPLDKISVMLGYSGKKLHNHCAIMERISKDCRFDSIKNKIHVIAAMNRGSSPEYTEKVERSIKMTGVTYTLLKDDYATDLDVAKLRCATNILFQLSDFDYLSASVKENLCAGAIMICGNWFPYQILKDDGFIYPEVRNIEEGVSRFYDIIEHYDSYREMVQSNRQVGASKFTWKACIKDWVDCYQDVLL